MAKQFIKKVVRLGGVDLKRYNKALDRYKKLYDKYRKFTMIPEDIFVDNLELGCRFLRVEGDIVECGVWRGGMVAAMAELAGKERGVHLFDSFEGLPPAKETDGKEALRWQADTTAPGYHENCAAHESFVLNALKIANHENYRLYKGWFHDTLENYGGDGIAILRIDGDWYDSVMECFIKLYPVVVEGGLVIIDDYYTWDGCAKAVHDYLSDIKSPSRLHQWNGKVAYIVKKT